MLYMDFVVVFGIILYSFYSFRNPILGWGHSIIGCASHTLNFPSKTCNKYSRRKSSRASNAFQSDSQKSTGANCPIACTVATRCNCAFRAYRSRSDSVSSGRVRSSRVVGAELELSARLQSGKFGRIDAIEIDYGERKK